MTALTPLSQKRIIDVVRRYGESGSWWPAAPVDADAPWQIKAEAGQDDKAQQPATPVSAAINVQLLITTTRLPVDGFGHDQQQAIQALMLMPQDAPAIQTGALISAQLHRWVVVRSLPLSGPADSQDQFQLVQLLLNKAGDSK